MSHHSFPKYHANYVHQYGYYSKGFSVSVSVSKPYSTALIY